MNGDELARAVTELCGALEEEHNACRRLYEGGRKMQAALAEGRTDAVRAALRRQDAALQQLERSRRRRRTAQERAAELLDLAPAAPFAALLERLPPTQAEHLRVLRRALEDEMERVSRVNQATMRLIEAFGRYVDFVRDLVEPYETDTLTALQRPSAKFLPRARTPARRGTARVERTAHTLDGTLGDNGGLAGIQGPKP